MNQVKNLTYIFVFGSCSHNQKLTWIRVWLKKQRKMKTIEAGDENEETLFQAEPIVEIGRSWSLSEAC